MKRKDNFLITFIQHFVTTRRTSMLSKKSIGLYERGQSKRRTRLFLKWWRVLATFSALMVTGQALAVVTCDNAIITRAGIYPNLSTDFSSTSNYMVYATCANTTKWSGEVMFVIANDDDATTMFATALTALSTGNTVKMTTASAHWGSLVRIIWFNENSADPETENIGTFSSGSGNKRTSSSTSIPTPILPVVTRVSYSLCDIDTPATDLITVPEVCHCLTHSDTESNDSVQPMDGSAALSLSLFTFDDPETFPPAGFSRVAGYLKPHKDHEAFSGDVFIFAKVYSGDIMQVFAPKADGTATQLDVDPNTDFPIIDDAVILNDISLKEARQITIVRSKEDTQNPLKLPAGEYHFYMGYRVNDGNNTVVYNQCPYVVTLEGE